MENQSQGSESAAGDAVGETGAGGAFQTVFVDREDWSFGNGEPWT